MTKRKSAPPVAAAASNSDASTRARNLGAANALLRECLDRILAVWSRSPDELARLGAECLEDAREILAEDLAPLSAVGLADLERRPELRAAAQESFASILVVAQQLRAGLMHGLPEPAAVDVALAAVEQMLDALAPYVTRTDHAMRRVLLEGESIEAAARAASRAGRW
jgi:hypothetical protein